MSDDALIRLENFKRLCEARGWVAKSLPVAMGWGRYSFWKDLIDGNKSFGEKLARRIEGAAEGVPRGWLDTAGAPIQGAALHASALLGSYGLSIEDSELLGDFRELLPEDREALRAQIAARAAQMREHARLVLERAGVKTISEPHPAEGLPPAPSPQPPPPSSGAAVQRGTILNRSGGVEHRSPALAKRKAR